LHFKGGLKKSTPVTAAKFPCLIEAWDDIDFVCFGFWSNFDSQNQFLAAKHFASQPIYVRIISVKIPQINVNVESAKLSR
jgi:hypothetical protein